MPKIKHTVSVGHNSSPESHRSLGHHNTNSIQKFKLNFEMQFSYWFEYKSAVKGSCKPLPPDVSQIML